MNAHPLQHLCVVAIPYRRAVLAPDDERGVEALATSGAYRAAGVPFDIVEPAIGADELTGDETADSGRLNGRIAEAVAAADRLGSSVLMTGGDCTHALGVLGGLQRARGADSRLGLVWFDAHGDFNTPRTTRSGSIGGMPVAVAAGLACPEWREASGIVAPIPCDRLSFVGLRCLDPAENLLIRATDAMIAAPAPGFSGDDLVKAIGRLADRCDALILHVDADVLDEHCVPSHGARAPGGPDVGEMLAALETVFATGKVGAFSLVSLYHRGDEGRVSLSSGIELLKGGLRSWAKHGTVAGLPNPRREDFRP